MGPTASRLKLARPLVAFDLETTGLNVKADRIVEISCIKLHPDGEREVRTRRLNPEQPISPEATAVHGIRDEDVKNEPTFAEVSPELLQFFEGCDLTGFNLVNFDLPILSRELAKVGKKFPAPGTRVVDSCKIYVLREPRTLEAALAFYCGRELADAHAAEADAAAAADVFWAQLERYGDLPADLDALDELCRPKRKDWADESGKLQKKDGEVVLTFGKYKGRSLKSLAKEDPGYLEWVMKSDFPDDVVAMVREALDRSMG